MNGYQDHIIVPATNTFCLTFTERKLEPFSCHPVLAYVFDQNLVRIGHIMGHTATERKFSSLIPHEGVQIFVTDKMVSIIGENDLSHSSNDLNSFISRLSWKGKNGLDRIINCDIFETIENLSGLKYDRKFLESKRKEVTKRLQTFKMHQ